MTFRNAIVSLISGESTISDIVGSRVYMQHAIQNATLPYIVIEQTDSEEFGALDGSGDFRAIDVRIDCKASRSVTAETLSTAVRTFLKDYSGTAGTETFSAVLLEGEIDDYEPPQDGSDVGVYVNSLDFTIQYSPA